ncbi:MAG: response regulator [Burkholderiales bacterium]
MQKNEFNKSNTCILVIDDDEVNLDIMCDMLAQLNVTNVVVAGDGRKGMDKFSRMLCETDFVIVDIYMPETDGIEFLSDLAKRGYKGGIMIVSGVNIETLALSRQIAVENGLNVVATLIKPITLAQLGMVLGIDATTAAPK